MQIELQIPTTKGMNNLKTFKTLLITTFLLISVLVGAPASVSADVTSTNSVSLYNSPPTFKDLKKDHWAYGAIQSAIARGYFKGYEGGTFKPNAPVTRAEFAALLDRVSTNQAV